MTALPRTTATGRHYLQRFAAADAQGEPVLVYRDPAKPGAGVSRPALDRLTADGLVQLGDHTGRGRPIHVTELGRQVLAAEETSR